METAAPLALREPERAHRVALAQQAFRDFYGVCFWWYPRDFVVREEDIPLIVQDLRAAGGHAGYRVAAELCR